MTRLDGSAALVTGASSGIGAAASRRLAAEGATVAAVARRGDRLRELVASIEAEGGRALAIEADVSDQSQAGGAVASAVEALGSLDVVVNNAGVMLLGPVIDSPVEEWERMVEVNLLGLLYVARAALPHLLEAASKGPRDVADLVNVSSVAGRVARPNSAVYNATKHGVGGFSESLRQELVGSDVRVSLIEPGAVSTEIFGHSRREAFEQIESRFEGVELLEADDVADAIAYVVTRPRRVVISEFMLRPSDQAG
jgi:NADP-dependent 3-hydroxy acid dehydrogenase YdfG